MLWLKNRDGSSSLLKLYKANVPTMENVSYELQCTSRESDGSKPRAETLQR